MVKVLNYEHEVSEFELQSYYYVHFRTNILEKSLNPLSHLQLWVKLYIYCYSTRMALA